MLRHFLVVFAVLIGLLGMGASPATAATEPTEPPMPHKCLVMNKAGELPDCVWDGQHWTAEYPGASGGVGRGGFAALFVLALLVGGGVMVWRVSLARNLARQSGMSTGQATAVTLLGDEGLEATYLAANLRGPAAPAPQVGPAPQVAPALAARTTSDRLRELQQLRTDGLVTETEYQARRQVIVDSL